MQPKISNGFILEMTFIKNKQTPATAEMKSDTGSGLLHIFDFGSERKTQNPSGVDSGSVATFNIKTSEFVDAIHLFPGHYEVWLPIESFLL